MTALFITISALIFFFGACIGSFLNVCIYRIPRDESIVLPRSHCPRCGRMIAWYDNIPILSWYLLRARCRHCGESISSRYVLVEALIAFLFTMVWLQYGISVYTPVYWIVVSGLVVATFVDFEHYIIPDRISIGGMLLGLLLSALYPELHAYGSLLPDVDVWSGLTQSALGIALGAGSLWFVAIIGKLIFRKDAMGLGDVKLLGAIGAFLGWRAVLFTIVVSSFAGSIVGIILIAIGNRKWQSKIPYGPYIALAAILWIYFGEALWQAYMAFMGMGL
jgi:leader peptidase (prepilin peptidase) / N-methyltransferase